MDLDFHTYHYVFPREKCDEVENYLKGAFSKAEFGSARYQIEDPDNDLIYLEIKRNTVLPISMMEALANLGGERLDSRKKLEDAMLDHEFTDSLSVVDIPRIQETFE